MKAIRIADLKAHLSEHLRWVRKGETITIMDRDQPIARIVPYATGDSLVLYPAKVPGGFKNFRGPKNPLTDIDVVALLREERDKR